MKVRAKTNGNILDLPDGEAAGLIAAGIYEKLEGDEKESGETKAPIESYQTRNAAGRHKRKDMRAEE